MVFEFQFIGEFEVEFKTAVRYNTMAPVRPLDEKSYKKTLWACPLNSVEYNIAHTHTDFTESIGEKN